jgi:hypothetical protein
MKKIFLIPMITASLYLGGCNSGNSNNTNADTTKVETARSASASVNAALNSMDAFAKKLEELKKLKPLTEDDMKKVFPSEFDGFKHHDITVNKIAGMMAFADYSKKAGEEFKAFVTDCSGELGAGKYMLSYANPVAAEDSKPATKGTETLTTQKKVDFSGGKAITFHDPVNDIYSIIFMKNERLMVNIQGPSKTGLPDVIEFATKFNAQP